MDKAEWQSVAERRVTNILRQRGVASSRQLETKISEAGPPRLRANPHHITKALTRLQETGQIRKVDSVSAGGARQATPLYGLTSWNPDSPQGSERIRRIKTAYQQFLGVTQNEDHGESLQLIVQRAIEQSDGFYWFNSEPGKPPQTKFSGKSFTGAGDLDHYLVYKQEGTLVGVEDKNYREWIYASSGKLRELLGKALTYGMLPVLVARKIHFTTRILCHHLGAVAFETHYQFFPTKYAERLADARHKDGLGFADIRFTEEPPPHVIRLFSEYLPRLVPSSWEKFKSNDDIIRRYVNQDIDYLHLLAELGLVELEEDEPEDERYEEYDGPDDSEYYFDM